MKDKKIPTSIRFDPVLKRKLELVAKHSRGRPSFSSLLEEAAERYIENEFTKDEELRVKVMADLTPRVRELRLVPKTAKT